MPSPSSPTRRSVAFLLLYATANVGAVTSFLPLLALLLPLKIEAAAGAARISALTMTVFAGAITASLSNILFGWLSDRSVARGGGRRRWILMGLAGTALSYGAITAASTPAAIIVSVVFFQIAVNAVLGPLVAVMADEIPDEQKGLTSGLLSLAYPVASGIAAGVVYVARGEAARFGIVVALVIAFVAPLVLTRFRPLPTAKAEGVSTNDRRDIATAWFGRMLFQISGVVLQLYLLYYFESITPPSGLLAARVGNLLTLSFLLPLPIALLVGRLSDRIQRRKPFLFIAALVSAAGLVGMALAEGWAAGAAAFGCYAIGYGVFAPLQNAFSMQLLPDPQHRGRDLGYLNLTNTLPSLLGPLLTWELATPRDFGAVMFALAALALGGGVVMLGVRGRR